METAAPTLRALELENQRLRADVAELVKALREIAAEEDTYNFGHRLPGIASAALSKHGS